MNNVVNEVKEIINNSFSDIYVIDVMNDVVYNIVNNPDFNVSNSINYVDFINNLEKTIHKDDFERFISNISLSNLNSLADQGIYDIKIKYKKITDLGNYKDYLCLVHYDALNTKHIIMFSEDLTDRLTGSEENLNELQEKIEKLETKLLQENTAISEAIYQINNLLENGSSTDSLKIKDTRKYINAIFNKVSIDNPELNKSLTEKMRESANYLKPSILIVDDSAIIRNALKKIFEDDFEIIMASNGDEAINIIEESHSNNTYIVGILLDLMMPVSDGFTVLNYLRRNMLFNKIPVAIISGDENPETRRKVYEYDIVDMLEKPFNNEFIKRRLTKIINLYMSTNNLRSILEIEENEFESDNKYLNDVYTNILNKIINNVVNSKDSTRLKSIVKVISTYVMVNYREYNIDETKLNNIITASPLYNIGAIAIDNNTRITKDNVKQEIEYGLSIIDLYIKDNELKSVANNIIKYSLELNNGKGYPNGISGNNIPIEASIVNMAIRLNNLVKSTNMNNAINNILSDKTEMYNEVLMETLNKVKKELKSISVK